MTDLGNQREVEKRTKALKIPVAKIKDAVRWVMSDERGRYYLGSLVDQSGVLLRGVYDQGQREMGLKILEDVRSLDEPGQPAKNLTLLLSGTLKEPKKDDNDDRRDAE